MCRTSYSEKDKHMLKFLTSKRSDWILFLLANSLFFIIE
jgi:hypothetical protein